MVCLVGAPKTGMKDVRVLGRGDGVRPAHR